MTETATARPLDPADLIGEEEARRITHCRSTRTWESWHERKLFTWYIPPGTNRRLYSRRELLDWIAKGVKRPAAADEAPTRRTKRAR